MASLSLRLRPAIHLLEREAIAYQKHSQFICQGPARDISFFSQKVQFNFVLKDVYTLASLNLINLKIHLHNPAQGRQSDSLRKRSGLLYIKMNFWMEVEGAPREREGFPLKEKWHEVQLSNNTFGIYQYQES